MSDADMLKLLCARRALYPPSFAWPVSNHTHQRTPPHEVCARHLGQSFGGGTMEALAARIVECLEELILDPALEHRQIGVGRESMRKLDDLTANTAEANTSQLGRRAGRRAVRSLLAAHRRLQTHVLEGALEGEIWREVEPAGLPGEDGVAAARSEESECLAGGGGPVRDELDDEGRDHRVRRVVGQGDAGGLARQQGEAGPAPAPSCRASFPATASTPGAGSTPVTRQAGQRCSAATASVPVPVPMSIRWARGPLTIAATSSSSRLPAGAMIGAHHRW